MSWIDKIKAGIGGKKPPRMKISGLTAKNVKNRFILPSWKPTLRFALTAITIFAWKPGKESIN